MGKDSLKTFSLENIFQTVKFRLAEIFFHAQNQGIDFFTHIYGGLREKFGRSAG